MVPCKEYVPKILSLVILMSILELSATLAHSANSREPLDFSHAS